MKYWKHTTAFAIAALVSAAPAAAQQRVAAGNAEEAAGAGEAEVKRSTAPANPAVYRAAMAHRGSRILVSVNERRLLLLAGRDTLMDVTVAVGMSEPFEYEGRRFNFDTPTGQRRVLSKSPNPTWTPPDWHYMERATEHNLELVRLTKDSKIELEDGSFLVVIGDEVGRVNHFGNFWPFTPGLEIVFDGKIFMPPFGTKQRTIPDALGPYKLDMGEGYLIHGTHMWNEDSVGQAVSHGCVRMTNSDLDRLYHMVERGIPVFIY